MIVGLATFDEMAGGSARYLSGLSGALTDLGHEVHVVTGARFVRSVGFSERGIRGQVVRTLRRVFVVIPYSFARTLAVRPDVLNVHFALDGLGATLAASILRIPIVVNFQGPWAAEATATGVRGRWPFSTHLRGLIERLSYGRASAAVVLSSAFGQLLSARYGVDPLRVHVIPAGIDASRFSTGVDQQAARRQLGLPDGFLAVSVRRLVPRMGLDIAVRATARMQRDDDVHLVIAGTGPEERPLKRLARDLGVENRVHLLGRVPDDLLPLLYRAADVCLVPTRELEGFGYVALEALAAGTPVIASANGGLVELVGPLEQRWLVDADPTSFAAALRELAHNRHAYPDAAACRNYASTFDWAHVAALVSSVFDSVRR